MKRKSSIYYSIICCLFIHNLKSNDNQPSANVEHYHQEFKPLYKEHDLLAPIHFSGMGMQSYIQQIFNRALYGQEILPNDFRHVLQLLHHGKKTGSKAYAKSVLKLFTNKLKSASYVNAYAFETLLKNLEHYCAPYVTSSPRIAYEPLKQKVHDILYSSFLGQFDQFKQDPDAFFAQISHSVVQELHRAYDTTEVTEKEVQQALFRFIDVCLNKLIWSPQDHESVWPVIKNIAQHLEQLCDNECLGDVDDLDDLYWSLVHRFCFFIDVASPDLPICFYETIKQDLAAQPLLLCDLEEQEEHLQTKGQCLTQALLAGEAKARMKVMG